VGNQPAQERVAVPGIGTVPPVRQLLPTSDDVDPVESYLAAVRPAPDGRPWVVVGMVSSLDGATAVGGRSGPLGGPADREVFRAVRAVADVILVAGGTARAEGYGPVRLSEPIRAARRAAGRSTDLPRLAVVTGSLDVDLARLAGDGDGERPLVLTSEAADATRRRQAEAHAEVRVLGRYEVELAAALASLRADGAGVVVCEGGPRLNAGLVGADLADEWCVTVAPAVVGGESHRLVHGAAPVAERGDLALAQLLEADGALFGRWIRAS
jgi:riboflavin biosynthesis pyrimidine reductase